MCFGIFNAKKIALFFAAIWYIFLVFERYGINNGNAIKLSLASLVELESVISEISGYYVCTNEQALSVISNYPAQTRSRKFKFDDHLIDPVAGSSENRQSYLELLNFSKENESDLVSQVPTGKELAQLMPVELFCTHLSQLIKCLVKNFSPSSRDDGHLYFKTPSNFTWLVYKGSHGKVVVGYLTSPSSRIRYNNDGIEDDEYHSNVSSERYSSNEREFLYVNLRDTLKLDTTSEFYKRFKPSHSGSMSNIKIYFHGNGLYYPGWLEEGTTAQVVVKGEIRMNNNKSDMFWAREREYTLFLSSSEVWRSRDNKYLNFVPGIFSIYHIVNYSNNSNFKGRYASNVNSNTLSSRHLIEDIKNRNSSLPEFMIMEYTRGMRFFELLRRLKSISAVYFYNSTNDWQGWFKNALYLFHLSLYIVSTFSTTGRYLYLHCDFHGNNIIVHNVPSNTLSRILFTNMQKIVKIERIKLIDLMFVWTPKNVGDRNKSNPCTEGHEVAISDIECLNSLVLGRLFLWDNFPFDSTPEKTDSYLKIYKKSKELFGYIYNIPEWRRISSYYIGGGPEWFQQWRSVGKSNKKVSINTFNEQFEGVMVVCDYLSKFMSTNEVPQEPCFSFGSYLRGYNLLSYRIMRVGNCIRRNVGHFFKNISDFKNERISNSIEIPYWELSRLTLILYWNILATNMRTCLPPSSKGNSQGDYSESSYRFEFSSKVKSGSDVRLNTTLERKHCDIILSCLDGEDNEFKEKYERLYKVNNEVNGFKFTGINGTSSLKSAFSTFIKDVRQNENNESYSTSRSLNNLKLETILALNGNNGFGVSDKSPNLVRSQKIFDYEEFLLDRWIYNLYHQHSFSPSIVLAGIRYSFRIEPTLSGKSGKIINILEYIKRSAFISGFIANNDPKLPASANSERDISEAELAHSCNMFYLTYYVIAIGFYAKEDERCSRVLENIYSSAGYDKFTRHKEYRKYYDEIKSVLFAENGDQELFIIDKNNICTYNYFDIGSNNTPNSEFIHQGFCEVLLKPLKNIKLVL